MVASKKGILMSSRWVYLGNARVRQLSELITCFKVKSVQGIRSRFQSRPERLVGLPYHSIRRVYRLLQS
jgi:hypothetical protein